MLEPPPEELPVVEAGPEGGCPAAFAGCFDAPNAAALADNLERLRAYGRRAWALCGTPPKTPVIPGPYRPRRLLIPPAQ